MPIQLGAVASTVRLLQLKCEAVTIIKGKIFSVHQKQIMAISEFEIKRLGKLVGQYVQKIRPHAYIRNELDFDFRIHQQSVEIFEIRPAWGEPTEKIEHPVAKATYVKTTGIWKVFWQRADLKWHSYKPKPTVARIEEFLAIVEKDQHGCFFG